MLKSSLLHPEILHALGRSGHGSKVLISDGNFPHWTKRGPNAQLVYLNVAPGLLDVVQVLKLLVTSIPLEAANVMDYARTGPYALTEEPRIWGDFRRELPGMELVKLERFKFYDAASAPDVCLTIATGEQRIYANLLLTIGVVK